MEQHVPTVEEALSLFPQPADDPPINLPTSRREPMDIGLPTDKARVRVERRVLDLLSVYPVLSLSMIGLHCMPYSRNWRVVFEDMITAGKVQRVTLEGDRGQIKQAFRIPGVGNRLEWVS